MIKIENQPKVPLAPTKAPELVGLELFLDEVNIELNRIISELLKRNTDLPSAQIDSSLTSKFSVDLFTKYKSHYLFAHDAIRIDIGQIFELISKIENEVRVFHTVVLLVAAHEMGHHVLIKLSENHSIFFKETGADQENFCDFVAGLLVGIILKQRTSKLYQIIFDESSLMSKDSYIRLLSIIGADTTGGRYGTSAERAAHFWAGMTTESGTLALERMIETVIHDYSTIDDK